MAKTAKVWTEEEMVKQIIDQWNANKKWMATSVVMRKFHISKQKAEAIRQEAVVTYHQNRRKQIQQRTPEIEIVDLRWSSHNFKYNIFVYTKSSGVLNKVTSKELKLIADLFRNFYRQALAEQNNEEVKCDGEV